MLLVLYKICCSCCSNISEQQNSNKNGVIYYCLMLLMCWLKAFYCIHLLCGSICNKLIISDLCILFPDATYIAAWMIDYCNLIGRKVVFETSETCFWGCFTLFSQWIRTMRKYCILNEVHLSSIRLQKYKIPWCFHR